MTNSATIETVDRKLEYIVSVLVRMADEQSEIAKIQAESVRELIRLLNERRA